MSSLTSHLRHKLTPIFVIKVALMVGVLISAYDAYFLSNSLIPTPLNTDGPSSLSSGFSFWVKGGALALAGGWTALFIGIKKIERLYFDILISPLVSRLTPRHLFGGSLMMTIAYLSSWVALERFNGPGVRRLWMVATIGAMSFIVFAFTSSASKHREQNREQQMEQGRLSSLYWISAGLLLIVTCLTLCWLEIPTLTALSLWSAPAFVSGGLFILSLVFCLAITLHRPSPSLLSPLSLVSLSLCSLWGPLCVCTLTPLEEATLRSRMPLRASALYLRENAVTSHPKPPLNIDQARCAPSSDPFLPRRLTKTEKHQVESFWSPPSHRSKRKRKKRRPPPRRRPDIILFTVDSLRAEFTSPGGASPALTPQLHRWAKRGVIFTQAYSPASSTRQTFRALFTGALPSLVSAPPTKKWALSFTPKQPTLAEFILEAGYRTVAIISAEKVFTSHPHALRGFGEVDRTPARVWRRDRYAASTHVDRVITALSDPMRGPTFVWTHLLDTHQYYSPGPHPKKFRGAHGRYRSSIHAVDRALGRLLDFARSPERRDHTIVIFTADHGQSLGEWGLSKNLHGFSTLSSETHVPLTIWGPRFKPARIDEPISLLDLFPTLTRWVGRPEPLGGCARDLTEALLGHQQLTPRPFMLEQVPDESKDTFGVSWISKRRKLDGLPHRGLWAIQDLSPDAPPPLQALPKDPPPQRDNAELREMKSELRSYLESIGRAPSIYGL